METEGWKVLVKEHPPLLEQVFKALATQVFLKLIFYHPNYFLSKHLQ